MARRLCVGIAFVVLAASCGGPPASARTPATASPSHGVGVPSPAANPSYPPRTVADVVALADEGVERKFIGMEGEPLGPCDRAWMRVDEPAGLTARQMAADLLKVSIERHAFTKSCGGFIFGTTDRKPCNCYHAEHGYVEIDRGAIGAPAPGKMSVVFALTDSNPSPADWSVVVDAPN